MKNLVTVTLLLVLCISSSAIPAQQATPKVLIQTNLGNISVELFPNDSPVTVENFLQHVVSDFYSDTFFHRVIAGFMIQGGGYYFDGTYVTPKPAGEQIINESYNGLSNLRGTIAMARGTEPNTATYQFFINQIDNIKDSAYNLDWQNASNRGYCVFGKVYAGLTTMDKIAAVPTNDIGGGLTDFPVSPAVTINSVDMLTYFVSATGNDTTGIGSPASPFATIQKAIDTANEFDHIILMPGTYTGPGNCNIDFSGKPITVRSLDPIQADTISTTIIDGSGTNRAFYFHNTEDANSVIQGLTITNCHNTSGGAIYCSASSPTIKNCILKNNSAQNGAAVCSTSSSFTMQNCTICNNTVAGNGSAVYCTNSNPTIKNNIIWSNNSTPIYISTGTAQITYNNIQGGQPGLCNIDTDPLFVDSFAGDFHLKSNGFRWSEDVGCSVFDNLTSRCIDAGEPFSLFENEIQNPDNIRINLGVYGNTYQASLAPHNWSERYDLNNDGIVNLFDYCLPAAEWQNPVNNNHTADLNHDNIIDLDDLNELVDDWLKETIWH